MSVVFQVWATGFFETLRGASAFGAGATGVQDETEAGGLGINDAADVDISGQNRHARNPAIAATKRIGAAVLPRKNFGTNPVTVPYISMQASRNSAPTSKLMLENTPMSSAAVEN